MINIVYGMPTMYETQLVSLPALLPLIQGSKTGSFIPILKQELKLRKVK